MTTDEQVRRFSGWGIAMLQEKPTTGYVMASDYDALASKYQRAVEFLRDIADLAGSTKRKQAGCETAAHALAQLGEPRTTDDATAPTEKT